MHAPALLLCLGDSYTIGEALPLHESFPYQSAALLRNEGYAVAAPEVIAKTGWTTDELEAAMAAHRLLPKYDAVTLLAGVNNQYRGRALLEYKLQLERLLNAAIALAGGKPEHVVVLSIPDYGVTPFGRDRDPARIAKEIDEYNALNKALAIQYRTQYLDITESSRAAATDASLVAADGLHPSATEYRRWATRLTALLKPLLKR